MTENSPSGLPSLRGRRILIVEDEMLIAMMLEDLLGAEGCEIVGPAARIDKAVTLASTERIDAAILDLNVNGREVYPVAKILADRRIPFAFVTGYGAAGVDEMYRGRPAIQKPFHASALAQAVGALLSEAAH